MEADSKTKTTDFNLNVKKDEIIKEKTLLKIIKGRLDRMYTNHWEDPSKRLRPERLNKLEKTLSCTNEKIIQLELEENLLSI